MAHESLEQWLAELAAELGVQADFKIDDILNLAADAAHGIERPAAPLTTFLVGYAAGRAGGSADDIEDAIAIAKDLCAEIIAK
ncbi:hypothetical protein BH09ACT10_BH09ACT10_29750 [soil metagenome]